MFYCIQWVAQLLKPWNRNKKNIVEMWNFRQFTNVHSRWRPSWSLHPFLGDRFCLTVIHYMSSRIENRYKPFVIFFGGWRGISTRLYSCVNILVAILNAILSFSMLFLMVFGRFPEKFSLGIFFSPSKPNTIRLCYVCTGIGLIRDAYQKPWCSG